MAFECPVCDAPVPEPEDQEPDPLDLTEDPDTLYANCPSCSARLYRDPQLTEDWQPVAEHDQTEEP